MTRHLKNFKIILVVLFLVISLIHVLYAAYVQRGLYFDGSYYFIHILNNIAENKWSFLPAPEHPRIMILYLQSFPALVCGNLFNCTNKYILSFVYSFTHFATPLLLLYWNYRLTKRTKNNLIFFFALSEYCLVTLLYEIFSVVETIIGVQIYFLILNYLFAKCAEIWSLRKCLSGEKAYCV